MLFWKSSTDPAAISSGLPLKVAMVTSFPVDWTHPRGGVEAVSVNLVRGLARFQDLEIHVVTTDRTCKNPVRATWEGAVIHRLPWSEKKVLMHAVGYGRREVQNYINKLSPDVIHAHDFYGIMVKGMLFPRIMTIHGFIYADTLKAERGLAWFRSLLWQRFEFSSWADHPHIVSISPYVRERLRNLTTATIHDIENPISETFFDVPRNEKKGVIFCAAVMCPRKNILGLVEAFSQIVSAGVDAELRVAGSSHDTEYERSVRAYIRFKKLEDRVSLLGPIGSEKIREELSRSSIFALTSLEEGAPLAVAEAMAVGVPVVASNCCGIPYMIREGETGFLVNPKDTDDIAGKMLILLKNDMLRARMGQKAQAHAREYYHPNRVAAKTRELYLQAVEDYARFCNLDT